MLDILFVTDFVCPYCLVAKAALEEALKETGIQAEIRIQPLELTPETKERVDVCHDENRRQRYKVLVEPAKALGLDMKLPPEVCPRPYTRLAFEGYFYAQEQGRGEVYSDKVYRAYFTDEKDIGDMDVLCELAGESGLDREDFRQALIDGLYTDEEKKAVRYSREELKVTSVPTIYVNGQKIALKTYTEEEMTEILRPFAGEERK